MEQAKSQGGSLIGGFQSFDKRLRDKERQGDIDLHGQGFREYLCLLPEG